MSYVHSYGNKVLLIIPIITVMILILGGFNQSASAENKTVIIPDGAANPNFDTPTVEWFSPSVVTVQTGDTIKWINKDKEIHNITSGKGISRIEFTTTTHVGTPDSLFQSGSFSPGQSWSYTFTKAGIYHYFCSIHPWMNGAVVVNEQIPSVATDASGQQIIKWPIEEKTLDGLYEADLSWEPHIILTNEKITLIYQFYDGITGRLIESGVPYELVIIQNGKDLFRTDDSTQIGGDYKYFVFNDTGTVTFRFQKVGGGNSFIDFSSMVYQNPNATNTNIPIIQPARNIALSQEFALAFILPSVGVIIFVMLWAKLGERLRIKKH
ncbi:MAG TPA: plastocyanin/azurin family copper-binding protein [Candidatus Nitrosotalea sp.]|nr:plastocyanin/azurin family copper-binding protein [Candidatus Nitrosotalea sp.]